MSVLIKGMEMPSEGEYRMTLYVCSDGSAYIDAASFPIDEDRFKAISVPPHGRLIDADELKNSFYRNFDANFETEFKYLAKGLLFSAHILDHASTVIPAERRENNESD